jgi:DNA-binding PucR family transcriptional regulator
MKKATLAADSGDAARFRQAVLIMKTFIVVLVAGIALSQLRISAATSSETSMARDVAAAKSLAFGGVGVAGLMSEGERNLRAVLERPDASPQLQAAIAHATPAGTLYILVGLRRCDRAAYQKVFDSLARSNDDVEVVRGCMIGKEPFRQLLSEVQDGRFDDYLSRPPR